MKSEPDANSAAYSVLMLGLQPSDGRRGIEYSEYRGQQKIDEQTQRSVFTVNRLQNIMLLKSPHTWPKFLTPTPGRAELIRSEFARHALC